MRLFEINPKVYTTEHALSQEAGQILAQGFGGQIVPPVTLLPGLAIAYGILRGTGEIIKTAEEHEHPYLYVDHSFFPKTRSNVMKGDWSGYLRLIKNGRYIHDVGDVPGDRFASLKVPVKPWRKTGESVVIAPMSRFVAHHEFGSTEAAKIWLQRTIESLTQVTDRRIVIKPKDDVKPLKQVLKDEKAWCLVTHDSMAAVEAAVQGVPVFTSKENAAAPVANFEWNRIEAPIMPEREQWLHNLAYMQFTGQEIVSGYAKEILYDE